VDERSSVASESRELDSRRAGWAFDQRGHLTKVTLSSRHAMEAQENASSAATCV
jgi:hypothetical protein